MIGSDHPVFHHVLKEACHDQPNDPVAHLTNLGWVCFGPTLVEELRHNVTLIHISLVRTAAVKSTSSHHLMTFCMPFGNSSLWGLQTKVEQLMTAKERAAVAQVAETLEFKNGRYKIKANQS